jgi:hypothetical protein
VKKEVKKYFREKNSDFYRKGISHLRHRWDVCVKLKGSYVEALNNPGILLFEI